MKWLGALADAPAALPAGAAFWPCAGGGGVLCVRDGSEAAAAALGARAAPWLALREVLQWDELGEPDADTVALVYFVRRRAGLAYADFESHYRERHAPLARVHHPGIARYVQNFLPAPGDAAHDFDAVSELWFRSPAELRERFYRDAASEAVIAEDVARFLDPGAGLVRVTRPGARPPPRP